jgi:PAS domain S-box-containing protein
MTHCNLDTELIDIIHTVVFRTNTEGTLTYLNAAWTRYTGYSRESSLNRPLSDFIVPQERQTSQVQFEQVFSGAESDFLGDVKFATHRGGFRWMQLHLLGMRDAVGNVLGTTGTLTDITAHRFIADQLRASETRYREIVESQSELVCCFLPDGTITFANRAYCHAFGREADALIGVNLLDLMSGCTTTRDYIQRLLDAPRVRTCETPVPTNGKTVWYRWTDTPIYDPDGQFIAVQSVGIDVTEQKNVEIELQRMLERERDLNDLKSRFVTNTSHEFRTPLTIIQTSSETLRDYYDRMDAAQRQKRLTKISQQVLHMTTLLDDMLTIERLERADMKAELEPFDIVDFFQNLIEASSQLYPNHTFIRDLPEHHMAVNADKKLLRQIVTNVVSNAAKYSASGTSIRIVVQRQDSRVLFTIVDHGIGIPPDDLPRIFELFHRGRNVSTRPGTGVGLAITKRAVELHRGQIHVVSQLGEGTQVSVLLPIIEEDK